MSNGPTPSNGPTLSPQERGLIWAAVICSVLSLLASIILFLNVGKMHRVNAEGRELTAYLADNKLHTPEDGERYAGFNLWMHTIGEDVHTLWHKANEKGWDLTKEERHFMPPPPPPW